MLLSLDTVKAWLGITGDAQDAELVLLEEQAGAVLEGKTGNRRPGDPERIPAAEMVHVMHPNPLNPWWGLSKLVSLAPYIEYDAKAIRHNLALIANHAVPAGHWKTDQPIDEASAKTMKQRIVNATRGPAAGEPLVTSSGLSFHPTGFNPRDLDWSAGQKLAACMICGPFGTSIFRLFTDASTYDNLATSMRSELLLGAMPRWDEFEGAINPVVLTDDERARGLALKPDLSTMEWLREDMGDEAEAYAKLVQHLVHPAQAARALGMAFEFGEEGDRPWRNETLVPAEAPTEEGFAGGGL
jgi:phage portal protein BeeE